MKSIICIILNLILLNLLVFCFTLSNQLNNLNTTKNVDRLSSSSCLTIAENDVAFALKLLKAVPYDPTSNQVFSPLALKLTLLSLASASADEAQAQAIYGLIFGENITAIGHHNVNEEPSNQNSKLLNQLLNRTVETTTQQFPEERAHFYNRFNWKRKQIEGSGPSAFPMRGKNQTDLDLLLCASFDESYQNESALEDCRRFVQSWDNPQKGYKQQPFDLTPRQQIELCRTFGIESFLDCVDLLAKKETQFSQINSTVSVRECIHSQAWQLARIFHTVHDLKKQHKYGQSQDALYTIRSFNNFIYQFMFRNDDNFFNKNEKEKTEWKRHFDWYGLKQFDTGNLTQMHEWKLFKRHNLSGLLLPELATVPSKFPQNRTELLNVVMIDKRLQSNFKVMKKNFYGPKFNSKLNNDDDDDENQQIYQIETMVANLGEFSVEQHFDGQYNHTLLRLPYHDHRYSLILALPHRNATIPDLIGGLSAQQLRHYLRLLHTGTKKLVYLTVPRFPVAGHMSFGPLLRQALNMSSLNLTLPSFPPSSCFSLPLEHIQQLIRGTNFGAVENSDVSFSTWDACEHIDSSYIKYFNRPFVYMLVGKYIELQQRQPSLEILVTGFYNGPEHMLTL